MAEDQSQNQGKTPIPPAQQSAQTQKSTQPPAAKPAQPPVAKPAQPPAAKPAQPPAAKPVPAPTSTQPQPTQPVEPLHATSLPSQPQTTASTQTQPPTTQPAQPTTAKPAQPPTAAPTQPTPPATQPAQPPAAKPTTPAGEEPPRPLLASEESFDIPDEVKESYPDLVEMILQTESMNDDERDYWFQTLPIMGEEQVESLRNILVTEKEKLQELDTKYQQEISDLSQKQMDAWQKYENQQKTKIRSKAEKIEKAEVEKAEEEILKELEDL